VAQTVLIRKRQKAAPDRLRSGFSGSIGLRDQAAASLACGSLAISPGSALGS
jgi:hypothetical protein